MPLGQSKACPYYTIPYTIPYHTIPYPYHAIYRTKASHAMPCHIIQYHIIPYHARQYYSLPTIPHHTAPLLAKLRYVVLHIVTPRVQLAFWTNCPRVRSCTTGILLFSSTREPTARGRLCNAHFGTEWQSNTCMRLVCTLQEAAKHASRVQQVVDTLEGFVDPFDLDVFSPYVATNLNRQLQRCGVSKSAANTCLRARTTRINVGTRACSCIRTRIHDISTHEHSRVISTYRDTNIDSAT